MFPLIIAEIVSSSFSELVVIILFSFVYILLTFYKLYFNSLVNAFSL